MNELKVLFYSMVILFLDGTHKVLLDLTPESIEEHLASYGPVAQKMVVRVSTSKGNINFFYRVDGTKVVAYKTQSDMV